jgi:hypothetical protein
MPAKDFALHAPRWQVATSVILPVKRENGNPRNNSGSKEKKPFGVQNKKGEQKNFSRPKRFGKKKKCGDEIRTSQCPPKVLHPKP